MSSLKIIVLSIYFWIRKFGTKFDWKHLANISLVWTLAMTSSPLSSFRRERSQRGVRERERHRYDKRAKESNPLPLFYPKFLMYFLNSFFFSNHAGFPRDLFSRSSNNAGQCNRRFKLQCFQWEAEDEAVEEEKVRSFSFFYLLLIL